MTNDVEHLLDNLDPPRYVRCYYGAFDSKTEQAHRNQDTLLELIREVEPEAHCTYFPAEGKYCVHVWGKSLSGEEHHASRANALRAAWYFLQERATKEST